MLRWNSFRQYALFPQPRCLTAAATHPRGLNAARTSGNRLATTSTSGPQAEGSKCDWINWDLLRSQKGDRIKPINTLPLKGALKVDAWLWLLEPALPKHLRTRNDVPEDIVLGPGEVFQILSDAHKVSTASIATEIFSYIAFEKMRWDTVVWLMKHLVESFATQLSDVNSSTAMVCQWKSDNSLDYIAGHGLEWGSYKPEGIDLLGPEFLKLGPVDQTIAPSLEESTANRESDTLRDEVLGFIWRGLGYLTIACAESEIKPEILEIIALLHHHGFMPMSIYESKPSPDPTAIQQSPILNLMSSRILTSLSDAAWRAHDKFADEATKLRSSSLWSKIPSSAIKVSVAGLRSEVWLELILWSCLHGGWINEGIRILQKLHSVRGSSQWKPISWRSLVSNQPREKQDWEKAAYLMSNWKPSSMDVDEPMDPGFVHRTVSSELVDAYIDASISHLRLNPVASERGRSLSQTVQFINAMQDFLGRSGLSSGAGSWDAIILRLFDSQGSLIFTPRIFDEIMRLSRTMGQEITASNIHSLPDYVFDGTAATFGLFHRALYHRIKEADVEGALRHFAALQERADENKRQSVADFLEKREIFSSAKDQTDAGQFTSNYNSIDYPAFYVQIPPAILGPFVELVTDAEAYSFGKWLLYSKEIDGPIIPPSLYGEPFMLPALVRFAVETKDKTLLSRLIKAGTAAAADVGEGLPRQVLQSFAESQINAMRWDAAEKILDHMDNKYQMTVFASTLAHLVRVALLQHYKAEKGVVAARSNVDRAKAIFRDSIRTGSSRPGKESRLQDEIDSLLMVVACIDSQWAELVAQTRKLDGYRVFHLEPRIFNRILEGVVHVYGSSAGRRLVSTFWTFKVRQSQMKTSEGSSTFVAWNPLHSSAQVMDKGIRRQRSEITPGFIPDQKFVMYAGLRPDLMTIRIVLKKAAREHVRKANAVGARASTKAGPAIADTDPSPNTSADLDELNDPNDPTIDQSPVGTIIWAARCLKWLGMSVEDLRRELKFELPEAQYAELLAKSPDLLGPIEPSDSFTAATGAVDDEDTVDHDLATWKPRPFLPGKTATAAHEDEY